MNSIYHSVLLPATVHAVGIGVKILDESKESYTYQEYIKAIFNFAVQLGGAFGALMIIFAGYKYMTSQGNPSAINEAKDILIGSLSGFALLLLCYLLLHVLGIYPSSTGGI